MLEGFEGNTSKWCGYEKWERDLNWQRVFRISKAGDAKRGSGGADPTHLAGKTSAEVE